MIGELGLAWAPYCTASAPGRVCGLPVQSLSHHDTFADPTAFFTCW
jgi:hypothetical protein